MRYIYPARPQPKRRAHPMVLIASASVIFFALAGGAAVLGYQPLAQSAAYGCNPSAKIVENSLRESGALNSNVSDSKDDFDSAMPAIGNDRAEKEDFGVFIVKS